MSEQEDKLKQQAELINIAMESVLNEDQARELIQGKIEDAYLFKINVDIENRTGCATVLLSSYKNEIIEIYSVFGDNPRLKKIRTFEDIFQFSHDMAEACKEGGINQSLSDSVGRSIYRKLDKNFILSVRTMLESLDAQKFINFFKEAIVAELKVQKVKVQLDMEKTSSIKVRTANPLNGILSPVARPVDESVVKEATEEKSAIDRQRELIEKGYTNIIECKTVLSPVAGVEFDDLREKQKILFNLPVESETQRIMAKQLGGVDKDGNKKPVVGEFIQIASAKGEYYIYAKGPGGVLLRSFEEGPVRIAVPKKEKSSQKTPVKQESGAINIIIFVALAVVVLLLVAMFLF